MQGTDAMTKTQGKNETSEHVVSSVGENRLQGRDVRLQVVILCNSCRLGTGSWEDRHSRTWEDRHTFCKIDSCLMERMQENYVNYNLSTHRDD